MKLIKMFCILSVLSTSAYGHSWYDPECCHDKDCAPIELEENGWVVTKRGKAPLPQNYRPVRPSQDNKSHACLMPTEDGNMYIQCLYRPTGV